jgi:hypothetical protein
MSNLYITLYQGQRYHLLPEAGSEYLSAALSPICINSIAWQLSGINRFTGAACHSWSVAHHQLFVECILRDQGASLATRFAGLHHDSHEAMLGDVSTPLKNAMHLLLGKWGAPSPYMHLEAMHELHLRTQLQIPQEADWQAVKAADTIALAHEATAFMEAEAQSWPAVKSTAIDQKYIESITEQMNCDWTARRARVTAHFKDRHFYLVKELAQQPLASMKSAQSATK